MPNAPLRPCPTPNCPNLVRSGRCAVHGGETTGHRWDTDRPATSRIRGSKLQAMRAALFARESLCRICAAAGKATMAVIRDHIVNLREGGSEDDSNIQPLCQACSDAKTHAESMRGQRRGR